MKILTFRPPMTISVGEKVEDFNQAIRDNLEGETTLLVGGTFTVRVADDDAVQVKRLARANNFTLVSEE